jgi:glycosyltransferase involved in cell wall biosynthesis
VKALYITYDGLLDPLGQSQILPYLRSIHQNVTALHIISFEKPDNDMLSRKKLQQEFKKSDITWSNLKFTQSQNSLLKILDVFKFIFVFFKICLSYKPDLVHARGHPMAIFSMPLKLFFGFNFLFDYRGVWADERVVKGGWDLSKTPDKFSYNFFTWIERFIVERSDHMIVLTNAVKDQLLVSTRQQSQNITVIPCACDFTLFDIRESNLLAQEPTSMKVLGYLGSIGPLYNFNFYLEVLHECIDQGINCKGLVVTNNIDEANQVISSMDSTLIKNNIDLIQASREEVPGLINQMDFLLSFITTYKSTIGACPTKIGEALACGIPIISNQGIGDIDLIVKDLDAGIILSGYSKKGITDAINYISSDEKVDRQSLRKKARKYFDLQFANASYQRVYLEIQERL